MSNYGVISTIIAPQPSSVTQPNLIKFETEYSAYKERVEDVNRTRSAATRVTPASIRQCMKPEILNSLCILGEISGATNLEEASDESVKKWFEDQLNVAPKDIAERVRSAVDSVKYKPCTADPGGAALEFVLNIISALDNNNCSEVVQETEKAKTLIGKLIHKLEPEELKIRMSDEKQCWSSAEKSNLQHFMRRTSVLAVEVHNGEVARAKIKRKKPDAHGSSREANQGTQDNDKKGLKRKRRKHNPSAASDTKEKPDDTSRGKQDVFDKPCLNSECTLRHRLKDCKNTSPERKKELYEKFYSDKKAAKILRDPTSDSSLDIIDAKNGRYRVLLDDTVECFALGDTGADFSALSRKTLEKLLQACPNIPIRKTEKVRLSTAAKSEASSLTSSMALIVSVTLILPESHLPVRLKGVEFLVLDQDMDEELLGRPFLSAIGFDLQKHLEVIGPHVHNKHISDLTAVDGKLAQVGYTGMSYLKTDDDPICPPSNISSGFGKDDPAEIDKALSKIIDRATSNGLSTEGKARLKGLLGRYREVFRIKLGPDPPAKVPPMSIQPKPNARPYRTPQRRYALVQREFISNTIKALEKIGAVYKNPSSRWASPALAVPKPGTDTLRFTVDLRGPNAKTQPIQSAMPHLDSSLQNCQGSRCFANTDFCNGYWQFALAKDSQEMLSIQTPLGVYTPTRLLQGGTDSGNHFQAVTREKFEGRVQRMLQWLDDFLLHAPDESSLIDDIEVFLTVCDEVGFKLHPEKTDFFLKEVTFCGRIINEYGVQHDPRSLSSLLNMKKPTSGDELQQFMCATNWMRNSIPVYAETTAPLHDLLEAAYKAVESRTKRAVRKFDLTHAWGSTHDEAFATIKKQIAASVKLAHPKPEYTMCLFTDASDHHWAAILTQAPNEDRNKKIEDQKHEPMCFLSGAFKGSAKNWSVPEKEGFAIVESMTRLDYLVSGSIISIFTDHANLVYIYDPYGRNPGISRHTASKLMRWALKLSEFRYVIEHMPGEKNVWADLLTRWAVQPKAHLCAAKTGSIKALLLAPVSPSLDPALDWPNLSDVKKAQSEAKDSPPKKFNRTLSGIQDDKEVLWIPQESEILKLRIMIAAHTGPGGHRGWRPTYTIISGHYWWKDMSRDIEVFVHSCLHCLSTEPGKVVPRPLAQVLHASRPNELIHFDFCSMSPAEKGFKYVLVLKDDHSGYIRLIACADATADAASEELLRWFSDFGVVLRWVSDQGTHFKNELMRLLKEATKADHHFTPAYCPWINGTVEVVNRELLRCTRALLSEFQLPMRAWPSVLPLVQSALNNSPLQRLGKRCPLTAMTGLPAATPLLSIKRKDEREVKVRSIAEVRMHQVIELERLQNFLEDMHKDVAFKANAVRQASIESHNRKTNVREVNFDVGDFVLRGVLHKDQGRKPALRWRGIYRVVDCIGEHLFHIEEIVSKQRQEAHGRRLKFFRNKYFEVTEEITNHLSYQQGELMLIESFQDIRRSDGNVEALVKWRGFDDTEMDWVQIQTLREDVPVLLQEYLDNLQSSGTPRQRRLVCKL